MISEVNFIIDSLTICWQILLFNSLLLSMQNSSKNSAQKECSSDISRRRIPRPIKSSPRFHQVLHGGLTNNIQVANVLQDDCQAIVGFGNVSYPERHTGENIVFKDVENGNAVRYP